MAVSASLQQTSDLSSGMVLVVFRDPDVPANSTTIIERTTNSASVANPSEWTEIGVIDNCDVAGSPFLDYLPLTNDIYWYRAKHVAPGYDDSDYIFEISGSATTITDIDWTTKPWLLDQSPLQLVMVVSSSTANNWKIVPDSKRRYFDALQRHLWAWKEGEQIDPESNKHHLAHAMCCLMFLYEHDIMYSLEK